MTKTTNRYSPDVTDGAVQYDWAAGDTDTPGNLKAEYELRWPDGRCAAFPGLGFITVSVSDGAKGP
ncbi:hypothetical protein ABIE69_002508 [Rhodobacteraceae bacterium MBR-64]|jgi:hypothetical protein